MCLRIARISATLSLQTSLPSKRTSPSVGSINRRIARAVVDFPHPLSPTSPRLSPSWSVKFTPSTAYTWPKVFEKMPPLMGKYFFSSLTSSNASATVFSPIAQPASAPMPLFNLPESGLLLAHVHDEGAPGRELAPWGKVVEARNHPGDLSEPYF